MKEDSGLSSKFAALIVEKTEDGLTIDQNQYLWNL